MNQGSGSYSILLTTAEADGTSTIVNQVVAPEGTQTRITLSGASPNISIQPSGNEVFLTAHEEDILTLNGAKIVEVRSSQGVMYQNGEIAIDEKTLVSGILNLYFYDSLRFYRFEEEILDILDGPGVLYYNLARDQALYSTDINLNTNLNRVINALDTATDTPPSEVLVTPGQVTDAATTTSTAPPTTQPPSVVTDPPSTDAPKVTEEPEEPEEPEDCDEGTEKSMRGPRRGSSRERSPDSRSKDSIESRLTKHRHSKDAKDERKSRKVSCPKDSSKTNRSETEKTGHSKKNGPLKTEKMGIRHSKIDRSRLERTSRDESSQTKDSSRSGPKTPPARASMHSHSENSRKNGHHSRRHRPHSMQEHTHERRTRSTQDNSHDSRAKTHSMREHSHEHRTRSMQDNSHDSRAKTHSMREHSHETRATPRRGDGRDGGKSSSGDKSKPRMKSSGRRRSRQDSTMSSMES